MRNQDILLVMDIGCASYTNEQSPHTPAPTAEFTDAENKWCDDYAAAYNRGFDAGANKAREDVLKQIKQHLIDEYHYPDVEDWLIEELMSYIQNNIESTQQQAGDHHE